MSDYVDSPTHSGEWMGMGKGDNAGVERGENGNWKLWLIYTINKNLK